MTHVARRRFGQHFLEPAWAAKVIASLSPSSDDVFLEIGPGRGALTRPLSAAARRVVAVEIDRDLARGLEAASLPRVTIVAADILDLPAEKLSGLLADAGGPGLVRVAGNLPYNVATPILFRLCELYLKGLPFTDATLMFQREVADRLTAVPATREYGVLTVLVPLIATIERVLELPQGAFRPPPKVRSTVVHLRFHAPRPAPLDYDGFTRLVRDVFTRRRKTLGNALLAHSLDPDIVPAVLENARIDGRRRAETLTLEEFVELANVVAARRQTSGHGQPDKAELSTNH